MRQNGDDRALTFVFHGGSDSFAGMVDWLNVYECRLKDGKVERIRKQNPFILSSEKKSWPLFAQFQLKERRPAASASYLLIISYAPSWGINQDFCKARDERRTSGTRPLPRPSTLRAIRSRCCSFSGRASLPHGGQGKTSFRTRRQAGPAPRDRRPAPPNAGQSPRRGFRPSPTAQAPHPRAPCANRGGKTKAQPLVNSTITRSLTRS